MRLNQNDKDKIAELVALGYGSRLIAKELGNKVSFQAISVYVQRVKNKQFTASIDSKLNVIYRQLVGIGQELGVIPKGEVTHPLFPEHTLPPTKIRD